MHHSMCDKGQIPYEEVKKIIDEQEKNNCTLFTVHCKLVYPPTTLSELCEKSLAPTALINLHRI